jgi:exonuclease III
MRIISWNVNGIRAVANKGFADIVKQRRKMIR